MTIISGTGHRPGVYFDHSQETEDKLIKLTEKTLLELGATKVFSGMAIGFDTALAQAAVNLGIPLVAVVPFVGQENVWPQESQDKYKLLISKASEVIVVSLGGYAAYKMQVGNQYLVDNCEILVALFNNKEMSGGTFNCVEYAIKTKRQIRNIWKEFCLVLQS